MIHVVPKPEASDFDKKVRQPGLAFLSNCGIAKGMEVPAKFDWKDLWTRSLEDLYDDYDGICAYSCFRLEFSLDGVRTDHFRPKKKYPHLAYEWSNYRLTTARFNSRKGDHEDVLDPFEVKNDWFYIDFLFGKVFPNPNLAQELQSKINATINRLGLNSHRMRRMRLKTFDRLEQQRITLEVVKEDAPFVYREIIRQFPDFTK